jgi:putative flippase GtrA
MKLVRYFFVGGAAAVMDFALFALGIWVLGQEHWFAVGVFSFVVATALNYVLSIRIVFVTGVRFTKTNEIMLVFLVSLIGLVVNQGALWFFYKLAGIHILLSKCLATATAFVWNFIGRNNFVFRELK